jgi:acetylornithine/succinyldiaminopimelate/putrescine aminotransferase
MVGFDLPDHDTAVALEQACYDRGLLGLTGGTRGFRFAPPLVIPEEPASIALAIVADACEALRRLVPGTNRQTTSR